MARSHSRSRPGPTVAVLTAVALAVVAFFAYQANAAPDRPGASGKPEPAPTDEIVPDKPDGDEQEDPENPALPADSGEGVRVVYSLGEQRLWLVTEALDGLGEEVLHTYPAHRSTVDPQPGTYEVTRRDEAIPGSDGVPIQHVVVFHTDPEGIVFGFSAAVDGSLPDPSAQARTGGIRQSPEDSPQLWDFAEVGTKVVVVP
ncbi:L,D-transpeptidase [Streptomyces harbinensis]|uniref:L,D-transpeptidase n=1 Tax=Streptomyces harbinensis TaxID=1176198 RepID=UPI0020C8F84B|nr:L,D-transpeptidase [Streptomyces harbinensis]